ncbi:hypothetical protein K8S19_11340 [bacterium]|nr:hypothetical protein [bacterium]
MINYRFFKYGFLILLLILSNCAMFGGVLHAPRLKVESIQTVWTTPDYWKMVLSIKIINSNPLSLSLSRVSYTLETKRKIILSRIHTSLPVVPGYGNATVEIPINLSHEKINALFPEATQLPITFKGDFYSNSLWQKSTLSFSKNQFITIPQIPQLEFKYIRTVNKKPLIFLQTVNQNQRPLVLVKTKAYLQLPGKKIMLSIPGPITLKPNVKTLVPFRPSQSFAKKDLQKKGVYLTGEVNATSDFGTMVIPITQTVPPQLN